jgi:hypothetical protein
VTLGGARHLQHAKRGAAGRHDATDRLNPLGRDQGGVVENLFHALAHVGTSRRVRHVVGAEAPLEEPRGAGEDQALDPSGVRQRQFERDVAAERVTADDRRRQLERLHEAPHIVGQRGD